MPNLLSPSPPNIFSLVWAFPLLAPYLLNSSEFIAPVSDKTRYLIIFNILIFYYFAGLLYLFGFRASKEKVRFAISSINFLSFSSKIDLLIKLWITVYIVNIIGSGGLPLAWAVLGVEKSYADFGLPTIGGLGGMLRAFILSACYLLWLHSDLPRQKRLKYLNFGIILILSAFVLEMARGNGVVLILHPIALHLMITRIRWITYPKWMLAAILLIIILGAIQVIRHNDGLNQLRLYAESSGFYNSEGFGVILIPAIMYTAVPIVNLDLNVDISPDLKFEPYYSIKSLVPSLIRDTIYEQGDYGELVNDAHNVSTFYAPLVRDYGLYGAAITVTLMLLLVSLVYAKAMSGSLYFIMIYPPLFMSICLSFFFLYFTTLIVLLYPVLVVWSLKGGVWQRPSPSNYNRQQALVNTRHLL